MEAIVTLPCSVHVAHVAINHALVVTLPPWRGDRLLLSQCCTRAYSGSIILEPVLYWRNKLAEAGSEDNDLRPGGPEKCNEGEFQKLKLKLYSHRTRRL
jgi:hypothetical protein